jgi:hypothetical protein
MRGGQNRHKGTTQSAVQSRPSSRESSLQQADAEVFILCGAVTATFRVLSLFAVTKCYSYSKTESATADCSDDLLGISNMSIRQSKPASRVTNTRDNMSSTHSF